MKLTGAAVLVSRGIKVLQAAPAAYPYRSLAEPSMSGMKLLPVRLEDETRLRYEFQLETSGRNSFCYTLIAKFIGEYRDGSAGRPDVDFIVGMTNLAVAMWHPAALVLDLSDLRYEWGDEMSWLLPPSVTCKAAVVVGPKCARAIATVMWGLDTQKQATEADFIFETVEAAWESVRHRDR